MYSDLWTDWEFIYLSIEEIDQMFQSIQKSIKFCIDWIMMGVKAGWAQELEF